MDAFKLDPCEMVYEVHPGLNYANGSCDEQMHNLNQVLLGKQMYRGFVDETWPPPHAPLLRRRTPVCRVERLHHR